jgi:hypothetical protein
VEVFEHSKREAALWFAMGRWVPGSTQDLLPTSACFHSVRAFAEVNSDSMHAIRMHEFKQLVASVRGGASRSRVVAKLDAKANILERRLGEKRAVPYLKTI